MLEVIIGGIRCKVSLLFPAVLLLLLSVDRTGLAAFGFLAALLHETGHLTVLMCFGEKPCCMALSFYGIRLDLRFSKLTTMQELLLYGGGPFANILCAALLRLFDISPLYSVLHVSLAAFNLLPIMPLDGGQMVYCLVCRLKGPKAAYHVLNIAFVLIWLPLVALGMVLCVNYRNFTLLFCAVYMTLVKVFYKGN